MSEFFAGWLVAFGVTAVGLVTVSAIGTGHGQYYLGYDNYYDHGGIAPAVYHGKGWEVFGLEGEVSRAAAQAFFRREHPDTGLPLVENQYRPNHATSKNPRTAVDCVFTLGQTQCVVFGLAPLPEADRLLHEVMIPAAKAALDDYEQNTAVCRRGSGGIVREPARLLNILVAHEVSRDNQPFPHIHGLVNNGAVRVDDSTGALDQRETFRAQTRMGAIYRRECDKGFVRLGYTLETCPNNPWAKRVVGVSDELCRALVGSRQRAILARTGKTGRNDAAARRLARLQSRTPKTSIPRREQRKLWTEVGKQYDFSIEKLKSIARERANSPENSKSNQLRPPATVQEFAFGVDRGLARTTAMGELLVQQAKELRDSAPKHALRPRVVRKAEEAVREVSMQRGLSIITGDNREQLMKDTARAYERSGYRVLAVAATKDRAEDLKKTMAAAEHLSAGQLTFRERFGVREQLRYSLSFTGLKHAVDPWAWSRWGQGHRMIHNRSWGIKPPLRVDRKTAVVVCDAHQLSDHRLGELLDLAQRHGAKLIFSSILEPRPSLSMLVEECGVVCSIEQEQRRGLWRIR